MNKLGSYFQERRKRFGRKKEELKFPELTPEEEREIRETLGIKKTASIEQIVTSTLRKFKEVEIAKEDEPPTEEEEYQEVGTVRIKTLEGGPERLGTLRIKKSNNPDEDYNTVKIYALPTSIQDSTSVEKSMAFPSPALYIISFLPKRNDTKFFYSSNSFSFFVWSESEK
jgi:hypothetical protein